MILTCDACKKEYRFTDDSLRALVLLDGPHAALPAGKGCDGVLRSDAKLPSAEVDFRAVLSGRGK